MGRSPLVDTNSTRFQSSARVCVDHFSDWCFYSSLKTRLSQVALPETPEPPCSSNIDLCLESPQMVSLQENIPEIATDSCICSSNPVLPSSSPKRPVESENLRSQRITISRLQKEVEKLSALCSQRQVAC
ncbi:hypothetical protein JTE90_019417 [Oedothorax gibbosus]|uniref:THAP-type domain-containing protein n=1 Tax=Oedothorax gibbosus TaxID=931172 RepID=A0AAV6TU93_9ARAC|nr:hypothetical protein JTE90_019417 [Oedothorax gibbosus]